HLDVAGLGLHHPGATFLGGGIFRRTLNIENGAALRKQRGELAALDAADLSVVGSNREHGRLGQFAQLGNVTGISIENGPADALAHRSASNLWKRCSSHRFEKNSVRTVLFRRLNRAEKLGALRDGVVACVEDFGLNAELACGFFGGIRLFNLIVVVRRGKRDENAELFHERCTVWKGRTNNTRERAANGEY